MCICEIIFLIICLCLVSIIASEVCRLYKKYYRVQGMFLFFYNEGVLTVYKDNAFKMLLNIKG